MPPVDPRLADELVQACLQAGKECIVGLIDGIGAVDNGSDWKPRFLLQALVAAVGVADRGPQRRMLADALLAEATGERSPAVRAFLLARLRLIAGDDAVAKLVPLLAAEDPQLADAAAAVLVSVGPPAKQALANALKGAKGRAQAVIANALAQIA